MEVPCEIDNIKTLKNGMKITLQVDDENVKEVMKEIYNFMDRNLLVDFVINAELEQQKLETISPEQRKKIYAIFGDMAESTGSNKEYIKENMKKDFIQNTGYKMFSLSNCDRELASDFIEFLINICFENGIQLRDKPKEIIDNIKRYIRVCYKNEMCVICGDSAEVHHVKAIGAGRDRKKVDDSNYPILPLCRIHHEEAHKKGVDSFLDEYHLETITKNEVD